MGLPPSSALSSHDRALLVFDAPAKDVPEADFRIWRNMLADAQGADDDEDAESQGAPRDLPRLWDLKKVTVEPLLHL